MLLGLNLARDTQCGFKLYRRDLAQYLGQNSQEEGFAFDIEHFLLCKHAGWQFREVGVGAALAANDTYGWYRAMVLGTPR